jgi:protein TonB
VSFASANPLSLLRHVPAERLVGGVAVLVLHGALLAALNAVRIREPVTSSPAMVALAIEPRLDEHPPAAAPGAPLRPDLRIDVPLPDVQIESAAPVTLAASIATNDAPAPAVVGVADLAGDGPVEISSVEYVRAPEPRYPPSSRAAREEGLVLLRVVVDERGRAGDVTVLKSSGHARLDEAALAAVRRALFKPYLEDGVARAAVVTVPIEFAVRSSKSSLAQR